MIDEIWAIFDEDKNGVLDYKEMVQFIELFMKHYGSPEDNNVALFLGEVYEKPEMNYDYIFKSLDRDGSGTIEKSEMHNFLKDL